MPSAGEACGPPSRRLCNWALSCTAVRRILLCVALATPRHLAAAVLPSGLPLRSSFPAVARRGTIALTGPTTALPLAAGATARWALVSAALAPPRRRIKVPPAAGLSAEFCCRMPIALPPLTSWTSRLPARTPRPSSTTPGQSSHRLLVALTGDRAPPTTPGGGAAPAAAAFAGGVRYRASTWQCPTTHRFAASAAARPASARALLARSGTLVSSSITTAGGHPAVIVIRRCASLTRWKTTCTQLASRWTSTARGP